ncbi:simple sugar transport system ATP-binding protein [Palleronia marisminoris]|uniref:Ribose import ATP-binding protein RbsA n=1 Tax=Palleronia marisminoris TaxID=315423 RepID=A0A1Y5SRI2_9RHOB|nr:sugar ABC transporter ATP-binding protein [Palleronia marisminoris]SFG94427.1 simple sugar transport system ATP-binding protein [Palleronia marisminoris]SLN46326.1 Ribose import ATP-binding protein RbsA [Palleronia marisminoris]
MLLSTRNLTKTFPGTKALDSVDFDLKAGEVHSLLGENGAGKSTLIKCLTGAYRRDSGDILFEGEPISPQSTLEAQEIGIGTVYQEVNLLPNLTVAENLTLGHQPRRFGMISPRAMQAQAEEMLAGYGVDVDVRRSLDTYSVAVQQIVAIARAVHLSGRVLILDEPTASLDSREVRMLFDVIGDLRKRGLGIIFISHFLDQVFEISDTLTVLRNGCHIATRPAAEVDRMELITLMLGHELDEEKPDRGLSSEVEGTGDAIRFKGIGRRGKIAPFDLTVHKGEVIGMAGLLGSGRTESAEVLFGATPADSGTVEDANGAVDLRNPRNAIAAGFAFAPEDRKTDGIIAELSVRENIILALQARRGWARPIPQAEQMRMADEYIERLDIRTPDAEKPVGLLSGGNQQKVILARWLATNPRFLILDEPTRGIDVGAHAEILRLIEDVVAQGMSILVISSELDELIAVSHRVIVVRDRHHVSELTGADVTTETIVRAIAAPDAEAVA